MTNSWRKPERKGVYRGHVDMACEAGYDDAASYDAALCEALIDRHAYRTLSQVAIGALSELTRKNERQAERIRQLLDELGALRGSRDVRRVA